LHYLRTVHASCYYCTLRADFPEQLYRRCAAHYRHPQNKNATKSVTAEKWEAELDERLPLWLDRDAVDPAKFGGERAEALLEQVCEAHIQQEEENKFRCGECSKLFSAHKFMVKHIQTKHPELIEGKVDFGRLSFFNNYALDPAKLSFPPDQPPPVQTGRMTMPGPLPGAHLPPQMGPPVPIHQAFNSLGGGGYAGGTDARGSPMGGHGRARRMRDGGEDRDGRERREGPAPPPPVGARMDPRAAKGERSYADLDDAPAGPGEMVLKY